VNRRYGIWYFIQICGADVDGGYGRRRGYKFKKGQRLMSVQWHDFDAVYCTAKKV